MKKEELDGGEKLRLVVRDRRTVPAQSADRFGLLLKLPSTCVDLCMIFHVTDTKKLCSQIQVRSFSIK